MDILKRRTASGLVIALFTATSLALIPLLGVACSDDEESSSPTAAATEESPPAATSPEETASPSETVWLCRPGLVDNPCEADLNTTVITADGSTTTEEAAPAEDPPIDCFYVYPTVSAQQSVNADLTIDPQQIAVAIIQASRFSSVCRVYAPMYRQMTLKTIGSADRAAPGVRDIAYSGVLAAWQDYLANYNNGRGVVLIGHSQGTMMLTRLVAEEIDPIEKARELLVSALLIGGNVMVAKGKDVGGSFENVPACRAPDQTGCVVAYSTFLEPPPTDAVFGRVRTWVSSDEVAERDLEVLCVNPASPSGGTTEITPYFTTGGLPKGTSAIASAAVGWVSYPDLYSAHCESVDGANWLQIDVTGTVGERPVVSQGLGPDWGLHLYDVGIALGDLVDLVRQQSAAYAQ